VNNQLRVAVVSTPRTGNTWVRSVLGEILELQQIAVHNYTELGKLPDRCIVQLHWYRESNFQKFLSENGFRVLVLARHPLDVLISILNFVRHEPQTARWLEGNAEIPNDIAGKPPTSREFIRYATSWGAENVLSISYQWWHHAGAVKARYEDLLRRPGDALLDLARRFDPGARDRSGAIERFSLDFFKKLPNKHGWQGKPGLWRELILCSDARAIRRRHQRIFDVLGYSVGAYWLTRATALRKWKQLTGEEMALASGSHSVGRANPSAQAGMES
jgi:hypothetical protein